MLGTSLQKRLGFEALEQKRVLATTTVSIVDGDLVVSGDAADDYVLIARLNDISNGNIVRVVGQGSRFDINAPFTTLVSEIPQAPVYGTIQGFTIIDIPASLVTRDVLFDLGLGNDELMIFGDQNVDAVLEDFVPRDLVINTGDGNDFVSMGLYGNHFDVVPPFLPAPVSIGRDLVLNSGLGDDAFYMGDGTLVEDDVTITDTGGNNFIRFFGLDFHPGVLDVANYTTAIYGDLTITTGAGADDLLLEDFDVAGNVTVTVGGGDDSVVFLPGVDEPFIARQSQFGGNLLVSLGSGVNAGSVAAVDVAGSVTISGAGSNEIILGTVNIGAALTVITGSGADSVLVSDVTADVGVVVTAGGADYVAIGESAFDLLWVQLGGGDDVLDLFDADAILAILSGGGGSDTLTDYGENDLLIALELGFESFGEG